MGIGGWVGRGGGQGRDGVFLFLYLGVVDHSSSEPTAGPKTQTNPTITAEPYRGRKSAWKKKQKICACFHVHASFGCCIKTCTNFKEVLSFYVYLFYLGFKSELLSVQPRWFALYQWRTEKVWLVTYLTLLPPIPAVFMTSLMQTTGFQTSILHNEKRNGVNNGCVYICLHSIPVHTTPDIPSFGSPWIVSG